MDELDVTLQRKFKITPATAAFLKAFRQHTRLVKPRALPKPICRDSDDDLVLATAVAAGANLVVAGDNDVLVLKRYGGVTIVSPRRFLERLDAGS